MNTNLIDSPEEAVDMLYKTMSTVVYRQKGKSRAQYCKRRQNTVVASPE